ncbi:MAG: hypothetical protein ABJQ90_16310 [Parasphingorhabdus sp.]
MPNIWAGNDQVEQVQGIQQGVPFQPKGSPLGLLHPSEDGQGRVQRPSGSPPSTQFTPRPENQAKRRPYLDWTSKTQH